MWIFKGLRARRASRSEKQPDDVAGDGGKGILTAKWPDMSGVRTGQAAPGGSGSGRSAQGGSARRGSWRGAVWRLGHGNKKIMQ